MQEVLCWLSNLLVSDYKYSDGSDGRVYPRTFFAVLNQHAGYANFAMFWQFLPLEDGLIFELVILYQY
jgi:hypothetical protein